MTIFTSGALREPLVKSIFLLVVLLSSHHKIISGEQVQYYKTLILLPLSHRTWISLSLSLKIQGLAAAKGGGPGNAVWWQQRGGGDSRRR